MVAGLLSNRPSAAPPVLNPPGTAQNRPPRSGAPDCRPWPRVALAARQHRKIPPDRASPPPSADLADRITNPPKPRGFWRLPADAPTVHGERPGDAPAACLGHRQEIAGGW